MADKISFIPPPGKKSSPQGLTMPAYLGIRPALSLDSTYSKPGCSRTITGYRRLVITPSSLPPYLSAHVSGDNPNARAGGDGPPQQHHQLRAEPGGRFDANAPDLYSAPPRITGPSSFARCDKAILSWSTVLHLLRALQTKAAVGGPTSVQRIAFYS